MGCFTVVEELQVRRLTVGGANESGLPKMYPAFIPCRTVATKGRLI